jgi:hypothetical protein
MRCSSAVGCGGRRGGGLTVSGCARWLTGLGLTATFAVGLTLVRAARRGGAFFAASFLIVLVFLTVFLLPLQREARPGCRMERENLAGDAKGKGASGSNREAESTDAPERDGPPRSSDEAGVMPVERRGRVIAIGSGQPLSDNRHREEPEVQWKAAAFARWHEPALISWLLLALRNWTCNPMALATRIQVSVNV